MVSVLHKELEYKVENLNYKKVGGHAAELPGWISHRSRISSYEVLQSWLMIDTVYHLWVKNNKGEGWEGLKGRGSLLTFFPFKGGGGGA